jgi:hypothetical membrane protein
MSAIEHSGSGLERGRTLAWLARGGMVGVCLYLGAYLILASIEPGYDHLRQLPSELGAVHVTYFPLMNLTFSVTGILTIGLSIGLHFGLTGGKGSMVGPLLLGVLGASLFLAGFFPCAEGCQPTTFSSQGHVLVGLPGLVAFPLAPFFIWRRTRHDPGWQKLSSFSLAAGIVAVVMLLGGFAVAGVLGQEYVPVITKVLLIPQLGWPLGTAIALLRSVRA